MLDENCSSSESAIEVNKYTERTHTCGELRIDNVGETVTLCGWLEFQRMNKFGVLRDSYGEIQILISDKVIVLCGHLNFYLVTNIFDPYEVSVDCQRLYSEIKINLL